MKITTNKFYMNNSKEIKENEIDEGATNFNGKWICNYNISDIIEVKDNNKLSIYVPSTIDIDKINTNLEATIQEVKKEINQNTTEYRTQGAWKCENGQLVFEDITILTIDTPLTSFETKLNEFIKIAEDLKRKLIQEGISIGINEGLMII